MTEDIKHRLKFDELKKRYRTVEEENDLLQEKLHRAQKSIKRLRLERSLLLDRIDRGYDNNNNGGTNSDSDTGSDLLLHNDLLDKHHYHFTHHHKHNHHHHHKNHQQQQPNSTTVIKPPKKKKDPNAPKGPGNVFFLFCRLQRDKIKDENPEENIGDVTKLLGLKWKALPTDEKQVYYDTFKKEMEEYEEALKSYKSAGGGESLIVDGVHRSQSLDPTDSAIAESFTSSPNITSPDTTHHLVDLPTITTTTNHFDNEEQTSNLSSHQNILPKDSISNSWNEPITHS